MTTLTDTSHIPEGCPIRPRFTVIDGVANHHYRGTGLPVQTDDAAVQINLVEYAAIIADDTTLTATDANGIVASDDEAAWSGVANLELPFP